MLDQQNSGLDRNTIIAFALIFVILIGFSWWAERQSPPPAPPAAVDSVGTAQAVADTAAIPAPSDSTMATPTPAAQPTAAVPQGYGRLFILENDLLEVAIAERSGAPVRVRLKKYKTAWQTPVTLVDSGRSAVRFLIPFGTQVINSAAGTFTPVLISDTALVLRLNLPQQAALEYHYRLRPGSYQLDFTLHTQHLDRLLPGGMGLMDMEWQADILRQEWEVKQELPYTTAAYRYVDESPDELSSRKDDAEDLVGALEWLAFKQQFFTQVLRVPEGIEKTRLIIDVPEEKEREARHDTLLLKRAGAVMSLPVDPDHPPTYAFRWYFGPLHYGILKKIGHELTDLIPLGWAVFRWVNVWLIIPVFHFLERFIGNYGIIIFLLAVFIKLIVSPFTYKSYLSTAKMKLLAPELEALREKYKDDPVKLQQAQLKLYQQTGVSPLGGCLPMLLQMPILIAMFRFFPASIELRQQSFLWAHDLSTYDVLFRLPFHIPLLGDHISGFALLMAASLIIYNRFVSPPSMGGAQQQQQQKLISYFMPVMFFFIMNSYSAALSYYYLCYNVLSIAQTQLFERLVSKDKLRAQIEAKRRQRKNKPSRWLQRLEEAQRQQQRRSRRKK